MNGLIVRAEGALFTVRSNRGDYICKPRGRFRLSGEFPMAGDTVEIETDAGGEGYITNIHPRENSFVRPPVANAARLIVTASEAPPVTSQLTLDLMAAVAEYKNVEPVFVFNKSDLQRADDRAALYKNAGYSAFLVSAATGEGIEELRNRLRGGISVLAGNSGVGKTSILNALFPALLEKTGDISERIGRGKQTTRHVALLPLNGGYVADTPGYSSMDAVEMELTDKNRLGGCFPEFRKYLGNCRYADCSHVKDDGCAVKAAVVAGRIPERRYESYVLIYERLREVRQWEHKRRTESGKEKKQP